MPYGEIGWVGWGGHGVAHWIVAQLYGHWRVVWECLEGVECLCRHAHNHGALWLRLDGIRVDLEGEGRIVGKGHDDGGKKKVDSHSHK